MQRTSANENQKQPFAGLFPLSIKPSFLDRIRGGREVEIGAHTIKIGTGNKSEKVEFSDILDIQQQKGNALLSLKNGSSLRIPCVDDVESFVELIKRLRREACEFQAFMANCEELTVQKSWEKIEKFLEFRADPYVMTVDAILQLASCHGFSDIHFEPYDQMSFKISYRIATTIYTGPTISGDLAARVCARIKYLSGCLSHLCDSPQEGAFNWQNVAVRVSSFPADNGERLSLRIITAVRFPTIDSLGWKKETVEQWRSVLTAGKGLILICGPVGSGKTTAMYASLSELARLDAGLRVVTIEDPVEAKISGICQSSLDNMKERNLALAFKHLLRQDPDVLGLGEIRDRECVREALQAALSGHLVLATFHAGSAPEAIDRIKQMGIEDYMVTSGLRGIVSLKLVKSDKKLKPVVELCDSVEFLCRKREN